MMQTENIWKRLLFACFTILSIFLCFSAYAAPQYFGEAKVQARQHIYHDRTRSEQGTLYCGCKWVWTGKSGGRVDLASCGYIPRKNANRAARIEWEHIVPAWVMGHQRQCWQKGGRKNCTSSDPVFRIMEADLFNLAPVIGEVNGDRSNHLYGMVARTMPNQYGQCTTRTDFKERTTEPRDAVKGFVARVTFYMYDRYGLSMSKAQQRILMAWDLQFPVSTWEKERNNRIAKLMGHHNRYVTGEKTWQLDQKPSREGLQEVQQSAIKINADGQIIGNRKSNIYHLPNGCPSYNRVSKNNRVPFSSPEEAESAGYRLAGNCR